jgi:hypothetical protein
VFCYENVRKERGCVWLTKEHEGRGGKARLQLSFTPHLSLFATSSYRLSRCAVFSQPSVTALHLRRASFLSKCQSRIHAPPRSPVAETSRSAAKLPKTTANPSSWRSIPDPAVAGAVSLRLQHMAELLLSISRSPRPCHCAHHQVQAALRHSNN